MKCAVCRLVKGMDSRVLGFLFCSSVCRVYDVGGEFLKLFVLQIPHVYSGKNTSTLGLL